MCTKLIIFAWEETQPKGKLVSPERMQNGKLWEGRACLTILSTIPSLEHVPAEWMNELFCKLQLPSLGLFLFNVIYIKFEICFKITRGKTLYKLNGHCFR
jgi:hypothetical protein